MLRCHVTHCSDGTHVQLEGEITEGASFTGVRGLGPRAVLDLGAVRRVNSFGVRILVGFLEKQKRGGTALFAEDCPPAVVVQLAMMPQLCRLMTIRSVIAPLECPRCGGEAETRVALVTGVRTPPQIPSVGCARCDVTMELAEPADRYFAFLEG